MSNNILYSILKEYEQKKFIAELDLEKRKEKLYTKIPKLQEIETELSSISILTAKNILQKRETSLNTLKEKIEKLKYEKLCILQNENINIDYLKPKYTCNICNDTGYIMKENYITEMCNCLKQKLIDISFNKSNMSNLIKENFNTFNENIFSNEVDVSKYTCNISPRNNIKNIKNKCIHFVEDFNNPNTKNLLFTGNTGLRKNFYV